MVAKRQSPEQLLRRVQKEEHQASHGKLKIYLGAGPGVGKTYEMLHDALSMRTHDLDVIIGVVESHGREDIEAMCAHFEGLPRQEIIYHDKCCKEFDLDAALKRSPALILLDEMAHSNVPGLRHAKRWQDINELLDHGINVWTTLNIQHIESIKDTVSQIINAPINETVPDSMIELADTIELVDLPPEELLARLHEGKIYFPQQATLASEHFFRKGNLIALRELALRVAAERVGSDVLLYRQGEGIQQIWPTTDKILVCVGIHPDTAKLIRAAKRIATSLQAEWLAVYVDTPQLLFSSSKRNLAIKNLQFAESLGAKTHVLTGAMVVPAVMAFAREHNVTQIMILKHLHKRWRNWFRPSLADELVRQSEEVDVYIMTSSADKVPLPHDVLAPSVPWKIYGLSIAMVALTTWISVYFYSPAAGRNVAIIYYLLCVAIVALMGRFGPAILTSILSVIAYDYFFIPAFDNLSSIMSYFAPLTIMFLVTQSIGHLALLARRQVDSVTAIQRQTTALYTFSRELTKTRGVDELIKLGTQYLANQFNCDVSALLPRGQRLEICSSSQNQTTLDDKEFSIAQWVFEMGQPAGLGTDTLSFSNALYLPLLIGQCAIGVLRIQPKTKHLLTPEQKGLLDSCVYQLALALDVDRRQEKTQKNELRLETERAQNTLLKAIAHDLEHPLTHLSNALPDSKRQNTSAKKIIEEKISDLQRLNHNLLVAIQLETKLAQLQKTPVNLEEFMQEVIDDLNSLLKDRSLKINIDKGIPEIYIDKSLMQEALTHLFDNTIRYSESTLSINISAHHKETMVILAIQDSEMPSEATEQWLKDKSTHTNESLGLGLLLSHKIISAHGGKMKVGNIQEKQFSFYILIPTTS